jgi:flagellar motor switch protein FliM
VMINQQKLFRGAIFEDGGSLFLTSLDSVKTS